MRNGRATPWTAVVTREEKPLEVWLSSESDQRLQEVYGFAASSFCYVSASTVSLLLVFVLRF